MGQDVRSTCSSSLSLYSYIWVLISTLHNCVVAASRFMVARTSCTCHLQLFKKNLCNKEVAKEPKSQIKILEPSASQKSQISGFWLQTGQSGTLGFIYCMAATTYVKMHVHD